MATEKQIRYYQSLCRQLGQAPEDDFENLDTYEASQAIDELKYMLDVVLEFEGRSGKFREAFWPEEIVKDKLFL